MKSVATLSCYVRNAISKEESHMEGMIANSTLELPERILSFSYALINAYYPPKLEDWNPLPVTLTLTEISRVVAANRTSVSLIISDWIKDGNAQKKGRQLLIYGRLFQNLYDWSCSSIKVAVIHEGNRFQNPTDLRKNAFLEVTFKNLIPKEIK